MKKLTRLLAAGALTAALLGCHAALAAEAPVIQVQLNGETLTFTDAVPQVRDQRTFLPFRAVFEAMGAEVGYEGSVITAVRDGKSLTMTLGSTRAQVTEDGVTTPITMDVAPYVDESTWRTYVPVRFAAQAFGCAVGWDQGAYTAILVDVDRLMAEAAQGKDFTCLEKLAAFTRKYGEGIWNTDMTMTGTMDMGDGAFSLAIPMAVTAQGISEGQDKLEMTVNVTMDFTPLTSLLAGEAEGEDLTAFDALSTRGIRTSIRGDLSTGTLYMNQTSPLATTDPDVWYAVEGSAGADMDQALLMGGAKGATAMELYEGIARYFLGRLTPTEANEGGYGVSYQTFKDSAEDLAQALSDEGFRQDGEVATASIDGGLQGLELSLTLRNGQVVGYAMSLYDVSSDDDGVVTETRTTLSLDADDRFTGSVTTTANGLKTTLELSGGYQPGTTPPETQPPAGAAVVATDKALELLPTP